MFGVFIQSPRYPDDNIQLKLYANTNENGLLYWWPIVNFNPNVLFYESVKINSKLCITNVNID